MKQLIDNDLGILLVLLIAVSLETVNNYVAFGVGIIAILVGVVKLITLLYTFKDNQLERKIKEKQLKGFK